MTVRPIPNPNQPMAPYLCTKGADKAIAFYVEAFGAEEDFRLTDPNGKVGHAELHVDGARFMLSEEWPDFGALSPQTIGGTPVSLHLYVKDVDSFVARAVAAGAILMRPIKDEFYGDRVAMVMDPFGHKWHLASRKEDVAPAEMQRRMDLAYA
jgi:PhnB protein